MEHALTLPRFPVSFDNGHVALAVRADQATDLGRALRAMGLTTGVPTVVTVSTGSRPAHLSRLRALLEKVVVTVAESVEATVVDEGDAGGLAAVLGQARLHKKAEFPFIGVTAHGSSPDQVDPETLDPAHTHLVFVPGSRAGLPGWVAAVATAVAGGNRSVALAVAGGDPAWESVAAQVRAGRLVMAVARSGGVADHLAAAAAGRPADARAHALVRSGQIFAVDPARGAAQVAETLRNALSRPDALGPSRPDGAPQA